MVIGLKPHTEPRQLSAFCDDLWVAEAGNRPFGYDPHSYTSYHISSWWGQPTLSLNCVSVQVSKVFVSAFPCKV